MIFDFIQEVKGAPDLDVLDSKAGNEKCVVLIKMQKMISILTSLKDKDKNYADNFFGNKMFIIHRRMETLLDISNHFETLKSRPTEEPHVVTQMFQTLGWEFPVEELHFSWLGDSWKMKNQTLWIHPGSGSKKKMQKFLFSKKKLKHGCQRLSLIHI